MRALSKTKVYSVLTLAALLVLKPAGHCVPGIPEPGLVMYGNVRDKNTNQLLTIQAAAFQITDTTGNSVSLTGSSNPPVRIVTVNNMSFYVARVPFYTRVIGSGPGQVTFDQVPNSFELKTTSPAYSRAATINAKVAEFANAAQQTFQLSTSERGRFEQVDFLIVDGGTPGSTYADFAQLHFGSTTSPQSQSSADPDGDGMNNGQEFAAGTDPNDPISALKTVLVEPLLNGGFRILWKSVQGKTYRVEKSTDPQLQSWSQIGADVIANGATSEFTDSTATNDTAAHYRIRITR